VEIAIVLLAARVVPLVLPLKEEQLLIQVAVMEQEMAEIVPIT
jgi:hypothetical protein